MTQLSDIKNLLQESITPVNPMDNIQFKPFNESHLELMHQWFQEPVINQYYARNKEWSLQAITQKYLPRILGQEDIPSFIIYRELTPLGFIQYYKVGIHLPDGVKIDNPLFKKYSPNQLAGIDLFIAQGSERGKGLGPLIINFFIDQFLNGFQAIVIDPAITNVHAIRCYEKVGFTPSNFSTDPQSLLMIKTK